MADNKPENTEEYDIDIKSISKINLDPVPEDEWEDNLITFYCRDCEKVIKPKKKKALQFICPECNQKNIAYGTEKSIFNYFHLKKD